MQLELFPIDLPYASAKEIAIAKMQHLPKLVRDALQYMGLDRVSQEIVFEYEPKLLKPSRLTYFFGYFQDPRYFDAISPLIKQTFTLPPPENSKKKSGRIPPQAFFDFSRSKQRVCAYKKRGLCGDWLSAWY
ncbi:hypothetical protein HpCK35_28310 [Helicobacter pylori]